MKKEKSELKLNKKQRKLRLLLLLRRQPKKPLLQQLPKEERILKSSEFSVYYSSKY